MTKTKANPDLVSSVLSVSHWEGSSQILTTIRGVPASHSSLRSRFVHFEVAHFTFVWKCLYFPHLFEEHLFFETQILDFCVGTLKIFYNSFLLRSCFFEGNFFLVSIFSSCTMMFLPVVFFAFFQPSTCSDSWVYGWIFLLSVLDILGHYLFKYYFK